jgi:hypothetical protein
MVLEPRVEAGCRRISFYRPKRAGRAASLVERRNRNQLRAGCPDDAPAARRCSIDSGGCSITPLLFGMSGRRYASLFPQAVANGVLASVPPSWRAIACSLSSLPGTAHSGIARTRCGVGRVLLALPGQPAGTFYYGGRTRPCPGARLGTTVMESGVERLKDPSKTYAASRVFPEEITIADVTAQRGHAAMPGLVHDGAFGFSGGGG